MQSVAEKEITVPNSQLDPRQRVETMVEHASSINDQQLMWEYDRWTRQMIKEVGKYRREWAADPSVLRATTIDLVTEELATTAEGLDLLLFNLQTQPVAEPSDMSVAQIEATKRCLKAADRLESLFETVRRASMTLSGALPRHFTFLLRYVQVPSQLLLCYLLGAQALSPYQDDDEATMKWLLGTRIGLDILRHLQGGEPDASLPESGAPGTVYRLGRLDVYPANPNVETFVWLWEPVFGFVLCEQLFVKLFKLDPHEGDILLQLSYKIAGDSGGDNLE